MVKNALAGVAVRNLSSAETYEHDTLKSPAFPDLSLDLAELFAQLPPQPPIEEVRESTPPPAVRLG